MTTRTICTFINEYCGVHVVFGHVISGQEIIEKIEDTPTDSDSKPKTDVVIHNCGELVPQIKKGESLLSP